jgi:glycosyltransferase involved in cell wall biosynthesis
MARILFLTSRFPYPLEKGDKLRAYNQIKQLARRHEVHLFSLSEDRPSPADLEAVRPYCASITDHTIPRWKRLARLPFALARDLPFQVQYFHDPTALRTMRALLATLRPDVVHTHLIRMAPYALTGPAPRTTLDYMDCFSIGAEREASWAAWPKRAFLRVEGPRLKSYERRLFDRMDAACIISPADRDQMPLPDPGQLVLVPNGVDTDVFHPLAREKSYDVLFTGHMGYPPNIAAARFTALEVMPHLLAMRPQARLLIAGVGAPSSIHSLRSEHVTVIEHFDHIREAFAMSRVMLAPMNISIGLQNKILQAMAMGIPVVTTSQGNAAIGAEHGRHLFVGDEPAAIAGYAQQLLTDNELDGRMTRDARAFVQERFTWERACAPLERMLLPDRSQ